MKNNFESKGNLNLDINQEGVDAENLENTATSGGDMEASVNQAGGKSRSSATLIITAICFMVTNIGSFFLGQTQASKTSAENPTEITIPTMEQDTAAIKH